MPQGALHDPLPAGMHAALMSDVLTSRRQRLKAYARWQGSA